jgi:hypothetical protein
MTFDYSKKKEVKITMEGYVDELLKSYDVQGVAATPALEHLFKVRDSPELSHKGREEFHSKLAKIMYLAKRVRPDLLTGSIFLTTRVNCATEDDEAKLDRLYRYLNGTKELGITLKPNGNIKIRAKIDASFAVHIDGKSHTGLCISIGDYGFIMYKSCKQKLVTKSTAESELVGISDGVAEVIHIREFMINQGHDVGAAIIYQDNMSTIALAEKGRSTSERTRHINIRYFFVHDRIASQEIVIEYLHTDDMVADILTKPIQGDKFRKLRDMLLNC